MNHTEAVLAITLASTFDNRSVGEAPAAAWAEAMPDLRFDDVKRAIVTHYRDSTDWLMPAHIRRQVNAHRADRLRDMDPPIPPRELAEHAQIEAKWIAAYRHAIVDGHTPESATSSANARLGITPEVHEIEAAPPGGLKAVLDRLRADESTGTRSTTERTAADLLTERPTP